MTDNLNHIVTHDILKNNLMKNKLMAYFRRYLLLPVGYLRKKEYVFRPPYEKIPTVLFSERLSKASVWGFDEDYTFGEINYPITETDEDLQHFFNTQRELFNQYKLLNLLE